MGKVLSVLSTATWKGCIAAGTAAAAGVTDRRLALGLFAVAFLDAMREELGGLSTAKRQKLARGILKARIDDLSTELDELGVETQQEQWRLGRSLQALAERIEALEGGVPGEADFREAVLGKLGDLERDLIRISERLDRDVPRLFDEALRRQQGEAAQKFEGHYLDYIHRVYGRLRMLGVREMRDVTQDLDIAYVSLRVKHADDDAAPEPAEKVLLAHDLLTIRGPAGSGKTTLLHWVMVQCTRDREKNPWHGGVPFLVPLRKLREEDGWTPKLESFVAYGEGEAPLGRTPPDGWIADVLARDKRGVVLLDGVDELPQKHRPAFWWWLREFVRAYPGNRIVVTARPFEDKGSDGEKLWDPPRRFHGADLDDMADPDIEQFITNWHQAVLATEDDPEREAQLEKARDALPPKLRDRENRRVRGLCRTPLLCSVVCALHWHEEGYLPSQRVELYERCCALLVDERDRKRDLPKPAPPYSLLSRNDKEMLLQRLALDMMRNRAGTHRGEYAVEVKLDRAVEWIARHLKAVDDPEARACDPREVLDRTLIERTGLVRKPSEGFVDFPHRSFQEYLAACAAGAARAAGELADHATDDQWWETIILAAGTKTGGVPFGNDLIAELLQRGTDGRRRRDSRLACLALAIACLETARQVDPDLRERVLSHINELVPPKGFRDAQALAAAGSRVVPLLRYQKFGKRRVRTVAACARTLALVGCDAALAELREGYGSDERGGVLTEVARAPGIDPLKLAGVRPHVNATGYIPSFVPLDHRNLSWLEGLTGLRVLRLRGTHVGDAGLEHLKGLTRLERLSLNNTQVTDAGLEHLKGLTRLQALDLGGTQVTDAGLAHLKGLTSLEDLHLGGTQVTDAGLEHLKGLTSLRELNLAGTQVTDAGLAHLKGLTSLRRLNLAGTQVTDAGLAHLKALTSLRCIFLMHTRVTMEGVVELREALAECVFHTQPFW